MKKSELKTTELLCEKGIILCKNPPAVSNYYLLAEDNESATEFAGTEVSDKPVADDNRKNCSKTLKIRAKFSFARLVHASVDLDYGKIGEEKVKVMATKRIKIT